MTRLTHALAALYGVCAVALAYPAYASWQHGSAPYALFFAGVSVLLATAIAHHLYSRDEIAALRLQLEPPPRLATAQDTAVADLLSPCCEAWWAALGGPHHCTRKDQTT